MMDEVGSQWTGLQRECVEEDFEVAKSCQFHYNQAVNREAGKLDSLTSKLQLKNANTMLIANSPPYQVMTKRMRRW